MVCGADELLCQFLEFVTKNAEHIKELPKFLELAQESAFSPNGTVYKFVREHGEKIIAGASLLFAIWKWWVYRERVLHKRLEEYIAESDKRLVPAANQVSEALLRPSRTVALPQPAFALELRGILRRSGLIGPLGFIETEARAKWKLGSRLRGIRGRIRTTREAERSLQQQQAELHMIAGALMSSRARLAKRPGDARRYDRVALREFRKVLALPGNHRNARAKESEAFQLLRLGQRQLANAAYEDLEEFASNIADARSRDLVIARSRRYRASIADANAPGLPFGAFNLITPNGDGAGGALAIRHRYQPFVGWEAIEQAETHYVAAYIAHRCNFGVQEQNQIAAAEQVYSDVLDEFGIWWFLRRDLRRLRAEALAGRTRAQMAQQSPPIWDKQWLRV